MTSALPDGRVPMDVLLAEKDEEFLAEWDAADAEALATIRPCWTGSVRARGPSGSCAGPRPGCVRPSSSPAGQVSC